MYGAFPLGLALFQELSTYLLISCSGQPEEAGSIILPILQMGKLRMAVLLDKVSAQLAGSVAPEPILFPLRQNEQQAGWGYCDRAQ